MSSFTDRDLGWKKIFTELKELSNLSIIAGILDDKAMYKKGNVPVAKVAHYHNVNAILAQAIEEMSEELNKALSHAINRIYSGVSAEDALVPVALMIKNKYRLKISENDLVDTGLLKDSILGAVSKNGKRVGGDKY